MAAGSKRTKSRHSLTRDPEKESILRALSAVFEEAGYVVRREHLKRGPGWRVVSGTCRAADAGSTLRTLVFVDRALPQDEQITFLLQRMAELQIHVDPARFEAFPDRIREQMVALAA